VSIALGMRDFNREATMPKSSRKARQNGVISALTRGRERDSLIRIKRENGEFEAVPAIRPMYPWGPVLL
jgi:hypothetical protein